MFPSQNRKYTMAQLNQARKPAAPVYNHEGVRAQRGTRLHELRRTLLNCLLWEDTFYESGVSISDRIKSLIPTIKADDVFNLAIEARTDFGLRHAPLLVAREMARGTPEQRALVPALLPAIINRPDEIAEFMALYWETNNGKKFVSHPIRRGLGYALQKFNSWSLAKWDRKDKEVRIRDAMFMAHVKPDDLPANAPKWAAAERKADLKAGSKRAWPFSARETIHFEVGQDLLKQTGTWEDRMSAGEKANVVFPELMAKNELGALAFIRNVRKMNESGVPSDVMEAYSKTVPLRGVFPHQLIMAARVNKQFEQMFDAMLLRCIEGMPKLSGKTIVLVDISPSMEDELAKNPNATAPVAYRGRASTQVEKNTRMDAGCAIAIMARELCEEVRVFAFSTRVFEVPARRGMALRDAIQKAGPHDGTLLGRAIAEVNKVGYDRLIVVTDEESQDNVGNPIDGKAAYMLNVAPYAKSVSSDKHWNKIEGWSPAVIKFISEIEKANAAEAR